MAGGGTFRYVAFRIDEDHRPLRRGRSLDHEISGRNMRTNQLARHRGVRAVARLGLFVGAIGVVALVGAPAASASTTSTAVRGVVVLAEPDPSTPPDDGGGDPS